MKDHGHSASRLSLLVASALLLAILVLTPRHTVGAQDDAAALLATAAEVMGDVQSFHFEVSTPRGETRFAENFTLLGLTGDVQRPDRFQTVALVDATIVQMELTVIGIGTTIWITDPLSAEGAFIEVDLGEEGTGLSMADLVNPDRLLLTAVDSIQDPVIAGPDEIDGVPTTRINGVATFERFQEAGFTRTPEAGVGMLGEPVQVAIWIDGDNRVRQLDVYGPLMATEAPNTVRRLKLSAFDEPVDIQPPAQIVTPQIGQ
jgi:lipoprotein LprA